MSTVTIDSVFRDSNTKGVPSSGEYYPPKSDIRRLLKSIAGGTAAVGDYRGSWDTGADYIASDLVEYGGSIWYALLDSDGVTPVEGATWTIFLPGVTAADGTITLAKFAAGRVIGVTGGDFGMVSDLGAGNTDNAVAFQAAIDYAIANRQPLWIFGNYRVNGEITIAGPMTIYIADGSEVNFAGLGANKSGFVLSHTSGRVVFDGHGKLTGPSVASYVGNENCINISGASTGIRMSGLTVRGLEIINFGGHGVYGQFANDIVIERCKIHNVGYAGALFLSCDNGQFVFNQVYSIGPGASANMYGLAISHDTTGYPLDPNVISNPKLVANPFCRGWYVAFNEVYDINWEGLDCHGGFEVQIVHNRVYDTKMGISAPGSSGDATPYGGYSNSVSYNLVDARNRDGTSSGRENTGYGININGGSSVSQVDVVCLGNTLIHKGTLTSNSTGAIQALWCLNSAISDNVIDLWGGAAINVTLSAGIVANNAIGPAANSWVDNTCIRDASPSNRRQSFIGNYHDPRSGNAAAYGIQKYGGTPTYAPVSVGNNFIACTTAAVSVSGGTVSGA